MPNRQLGRFLLKKILYCGVNDQIISKNGQTEPVSSSNCRGVRAVILDKHCYFETVRNFPFSNLKDIRAAIEVNYSEYSPLSPGYFIIRKLKTKGEETTVNIWFLNQQTIERLNQLSPLLVIPQSALLAILNPGAPLFYRIRREQEKELFIGIDRQEAVLSMYSNGDADHDWSQFVRSMGFSFQNCSVENIDDSVAYNSLLQQAMIQLPFKKMRPFIYGDCFSVAGAERQLKIGLGVAAIILLAYLGLSIFLPYQSYQRLKAEDRQISTKVSTLLEKQDQIDSDYRHYQLLAKPINNYPVKGQLLSQLAKTVPPKAQVTQLTISGNMVILRGKAPKASALLADLSQLKGVSNIRFSTPVRKDRKSTAEVFEIAFVYE